jgi:flagellar biosynthesis/type III secretory pathway protein FliH
VPEFVSFAVSLRARDCEPAAPALEAAAAALPAPDHFVKELALARLAALEAFDRAVPRLLEALARDVLARELALAPADLEHLVSLARNRLAAEEPVALWVAPVDSTRLALELPVRSDPALRPGDLVVHVRDGEVDARFSLRVEEALAAALEPS